MKNEEIKNYNTKWQIKSIKSNSKALEVNPIKENTNQQLNIQSNQMIEQIKEKETNVKQHEKLDKGKEKTTIPEDLQKNHDALIIEPNKLISNSKVNNTTNIEKELLPFESVGVNADKVNAKAKPKRIKSISSPNKLTTTPTKSQPSSKQQNPTPKEINHSTGNNLENQTKKTPITIQTIPKTTIPHNPNSSNKNSVENKSNTTLPINRETEEPIDLSLEGTVSQEWSIEQMYRLSNLANTDENEIRKYQLFIKSTILNRLKLIHHFADTTALQPTFVDEHVNNTYKLTFTSNKKKELFIKTPPPLITIIDKLYN